MILKKAWNNKFLILFIGVLIVLISPMLFLSSKGHLAADDFVYGADTHAVYLQTNSIIETIKEAFPITRWWYINWQGSYTSIFFMILQPGIFSLFAYRIGLIVIFLLMLTAPVVLGLLVNKHYLKMKTQYIGPMLCFIIILWTQYLPSPFQGLYWYNSAIYYTFSFCVVLFAISFMILLQNIKKQSIAIVYYILFLICLFLLV